MIALCIVDDPVGTLYRCKVTVQRTIGTRRRNRITTKMLLRVEPTLAGPITGHDVDLGLDPEDVEVSAGRILA